MATITIPKNLIKNDDLVVLPRKEYEELLAKQARQTGKREIKVKRSVFFRVPKKHERFYEKLDQELTECLKDCENGNLIRPFSSVKEMRRSLEK
ncbi:MAG: hypothetical protein HYW34_03550 [Candidatus Brennerbacteria bacterium]|nr:hypothetical protein [Candidatus Brennerbacteria bacterium]